MRELETASITAAEDFDFGEPEIVCVEIAPGKHLSLQEPSAADLMEIGKIEREKDTDEIEKTLKIICILHSPDPGKRKLTLKDARRLRSKQIKLLADAMREVIGSEDEEKEGEKEDTKSDDKSEP
jgi:hypothetical protein